MPARKWRPRPTALFAATVPIGPPVPTAKSEPGAQVFLDLGGGRYELLGEGEATAVRLQ